MSGDSVSDDVQMGQMPKEAKTNSHNSSEGDVVVDDQGTQPTTEQPKPEAPVLDATIDLSTGTINIGANVDRLGKKRKQ